MNDMKVMQCDSGYFAAERVPMNNLPGCNVFFWQQISKYYHYKKSAENFISKIKNRVARAKKK